MNQSKKSFNLMAMLTVAAVFALVGCDDSSTDPDEDTLVGSWNFTSMMVYYGSSVATADSSEDMTADADAPTVLTFNDDGTGSDVSKNQAGSDTTNTWTYIATATEITITTTEDGETEDMVLSYVLSGNTLTLTVHEEADIEDDWPETWMVLTFAKQ